MNKIVQNVLVPLVVLGGGFGVASAIMGSAEPEAEFVADASITSVGITVVDALRRPASISVSGRVQAGQQLSLIPQVGGQVLSTHTELVAGGRIAEGEEILHIDPTDYQAYLRAEQNRVSQANLELALETQRNEAAAEEWTLLMGEEQADSLVLREPHLEVAETALDGAQSARTLARLNLDRTRMVAPFDLVILEENIDLGQVLGAGQTVASAVGTAYFFVQASVPIEALEEISIPGAPARIHQRSGDPTLYRSGTVERLASDLDPLSQMAVVYIRVEAPLETLSGSPPLLVGSYVDVVIEGHTVDVVPVPHDALLPGQRVWLVDEEETLRAADLDVSWSDTEFAYARSGIDGGSRVVTPPMAMPLEGMILKDRAPLSTSIMSTPSEGPPLITRL